MDLGKKSTAHAAVIQNPTGIYRCCAVSSLSCLLVYALYGYVFVRSHALFMQAESRLCASAGFPVVIAAGDPALCSTAHQIGAALFFAFTLGVLAAGLCSLVVLMRWFIRKKDQPDWLNVAMIAALLAVAGFSREKPLMALLAGIAAPASYFLVFGRIAASGAVRFVSRRRVALIAVIFCLPPLAAVTSSYWSLRDVMLEIPVLESLSDFYYGHTLLAADVIKPLRYRSQNVVALAEGDYRLTQIPHGILAVRTAAPNGLKGARAVFSDLHSGSRDFDLHVALIEYSNTHDTNRLMRSGVGGALKFMPVFVLLLISWMVFELSAAAGSWRQLVWIILTVNLLLWMPLLWQKTVVAGLERKPARLDTYVESDSEIKRYAAALSGNLAVAQIVRLAEDPSPRVRLNALIAAGRNGDARLYETASGALDDPQLNVRTKACWALGRIGGRDSSDLLKRVLREDPAWYVRDYAFSAIGRIAPVRMEISR